MDLQEPLVVYLDQNKWVDLARAYHGRPGGKPYLSILGKIQEAVRQDKAIFPLSAAHLIETQKSKDVPRRERLAQVMAEISKGKLLPIRAEWWRGNLLLL